MEQLHHGDPKVIGPYTVIARLGSGGMGSVYLCNSPGGRRLAVKVIRPDLVDDLNFRARFRREVASAERVRGHVTAGVVDADTESRTPWLATLFLDGPTLSVKVERSPLAEPELHRLAAALAEALQSIHNAGLVHRDLKPSNIILASDGPRVIDFGIARAADATALTTTDLRVGSPGYMAPEQIRFDATGPESDIFALGAVLAYAATGRSPFGSGPTDVMLYRVLHEEPNLDGIPSSLRPLVAACLAKDPGQRPTPDLILQGTSGGQPTLIQAQPRYRDPAVPEPDQASTAPLGVTATSIEAHVAPQPEDVSPRGASHPAPAHDSVREDALRERDAARPPPAMEMTEVVNVATSALPLGGTISATGASVKPVGKFVYCRHSPAQRGALGRQLLDGSEICVGCRLPYAPGSPGSDIRRANFRRAPRPVPPFNLTAMLAQAAERSPYCRHSPAQRSALGRQVLDGSEICVGCRLLYAPGSPGSDIPAHL